MKQTGRAAPERMVSDSWPALHGRPVLRRTVAMGLVLFVAVAAALAVRGINALTLGRGVIETDRDRAELLAGLHPSQHPGAGRYYVPVGAVYTRTVDGAPVAYLHYRLAGGQDVGLGDFLRTYDLPAPGPSAPLPSDLAAALGGDEPAEAPELPGAVTAVPGPTALPTLTPTATPTDTATATPTASPTDTATPDVTPSETEPALPAEPVASPPPVDETEEPAQAALPAEEPLPAPADPEPAVASTPTATATPSPPPAPVPTPARLGPGRRIYVAADPGGLPGAADIYVRATG